MFAIFAAGRLIAFLRWPSRCRTIRYIFYKMSHTWIMRHRPVSSCSGSVRRYAAPEMCGALTVAYRAPLCSIVARGQRRHMVSHTYGRENFHPCILRVRKKSLHVCVSRDGEFGGILWNQKKLQEKSLFSFPISSVDSYNVSKTPFTTKAQPLRVFLSVKRKKNSINVYAYIVL